jgi:hypothetical protein
VQARDLHSCPSVDQHRGGSATLGRRMVWARVPRTLCKRLCNGIAMIVEGVVDSTAASRRAFESLVTSYGV